MKKTETIQAAKTYNSIKPIKNNAKAGNNTIETSVPTINLSIKFVFMVILLCCY